MSLLKGFSSDGIKEKNPFVHIHGRSTNQGLSEAEPRHGNIICNHPLLGLSCPILQPEDMTS